MMAATTTTIGTAIAARHGPRQRRQIMTALAASSAGAGSSMGRSGSMTNRMVSLSNRTPILLGACGGHTRSTVRDVVPRPKQRPPTQDERERRSVPALRVSATRSVVGASINGYSGTFLFDTGEGVTLISTKVAQAIGCTPWGQVTAIRMRGDRIDAPHCDGIPIAIEGQRLTAPSVVVFDTPADRPSLR